MKSSNERAIEWLRRRGTKAWLLHEMLEDVSYGDVVVAWKTVGEKWEAQDFAFVHWYIKDEKTYVFDGANETREKRIQIFVPVEQLSHFVLIETRRARKRALKKIKAMNKEQKK